MKVALHSIEDTAVFGQNAPRSPDGKGRTKRGKDCGTLLQNWFNLYSSKFSEAGSEQAVTWSGV